MILSSSNRFNSLCRDGRDTFIIIAHLEMDSGMATLSCIGSIMLPRMEQAGYPKAHSAALISSASLLGLLIPPSMNMILYAFVGGQSVLSCFVATVGPGILLIILLSAVNCFLLHKEGVGTVSVLITDSKLLTCALCSIDHLLSLNGVDCHRLFTHNVLACLKSINGNEAVRTVGSTYVYNVDCLIS